MRVHNNHQAKRPSTTITTATQLRETLARGTRRVRVKSLAVIGTSPESLLIRALNLADRGVVIELPPGSISWAALVTTAHTMHRLILDGDPALARAAEAARSGGAPREPASTTRRHKSKA